MKKDDYNENGLIANVTFSRALPPLEAGKCGRHRARAVFYLSYITYPVLSAREDPLLGFLPSSISPLPPVVNGGLFSA